MVMTTSSCHGEPGSIPQKSQINSHFWPRKLLATKLVCGNNEEGDHEVVCRGHQSLLE